MPKVMILDHVLADVIALEEVLKEEGYEVCTLTGPYGILAKFDYEKPDILLFNPDMPNTDTDEILATVRSAPTMQHMIVVLICDGDAEAIENYCNQMHVHGYYLTGHGFDDVPAYLSHFFPASSATPKLTSVTPHFSVQ